MSKTVKIPNTANPWRCTINGVEYAYTPGSTQTVPDEVAALIAQIEGYPPDPLPVEKPWPCDPPAFAPAISDPQDGDVLVYDATAGKWKNGEGGSGGGGMTVDYEIDIGEGATTYTFKAKAGDIYNALDSGASVIIRMAMNTVPEGSTGYMTGNFVSYAHITSGGDAGYYFNAQIDGATIENAFAATANDFPVATGGGSSQS